MMRLRSAGVAVRYCPSLFTETLGFARISVTFDPCLAVAGMKGDYRSGLTFPGAPGPASQSESHLCLRREIRRLRAPPAAFRRPIVHTVRRGGDTRMRYPPRPGHLPT